MPSLPPPEPVFCVRNQQAKPAEEHLACPYCFGKSRDEIRAGERQRFCDYDPAKDPEAFGFPPGTLRDRQG